MQGDHTQDFPLGLLTGDALGSLIEFRLQEEIRHIYPHGVRDLSDGGTGIPSVAADGRL